MASLDQFLRTLANNKAEKLSLLPDQPARLTRGGEDIEITKTPLAAPAVRSAIAEIAPAEAQERVENDETADFDYRVDDTSFRIRLFRVDGAWGMEATCFPPMIDDSAPAPASGLAESSEPETPIRKAPAITADAPAETGGRSVERMDDLLEIMLAREASDLHLTSGLPIRLRIHGDLVPLAEFHAPSGDNLRKLLYAIAPEANRNEFEEANDTDFAYALEGRARFRVNLFRERMGLGAVLRQIPEEIPSFEDLKLPEILRKVVDLQKGLVLVTGPTGSGKSTTLAALVDLVNRSRHDHIITIEDPIEFVHKSKKCLVHQREVHTHTKSFKRALRAALREDPDIVLVGEMRDLETIAIAIETAETGHLVFGTLHTTTAPSTVERLVDQFPGDRQGQIRMMLAESLFAVVAQTLLKKIGGGRVAAFEILLCNAAVSNLIREGKTFQIPSAMQTGKREGMMRLNDSLFGLVEAKLVEPEEAYVKAVDKQALVSKFQSAGIPFDAEERGHTS